MAAPTSNAETPSAHKQGAEIVNTTLFISNLHCPSCITSIEETLYSLSTPPVSTSHSIISHSVVVRHRLSLSVHAILNALELAGFEVHSVFSDQFTDSGALVTGDYEREDPEWENSLEQAVSRWRHAWNQSKEDDMRKRQKHVEHCEQCRFEAECGTDHGKNLSGPVARSADREKEQSPEIKEVLSQTLSGLSHEFVVVEGDSEARLCKAALTISGMTCASCVGTITRAVEHLSWVRSIDINLLTGSATVLFQGKSHIDDVISTIDDSGYDAALEQVEEVGSSSSPQPPKSKPVDEWRAVYAIGGMTCSSCVNTITIALKQHPWVSQVDVSLVSNSATVEFEGNEHIKVIQETIEDIGYEATLDNVINVEQEEEETIERSISIRIDGMFCHHCPPKVVDALESAFDDRVEVEKAATTNDPIIRVRYTPDPPSLTIREIFSSVKDIDPAFTPSIYHPPTIEERARDMHARERRRILFRLILAVIVAIPTFIIGIVFMDLVSSKNSVRRFFMQSMWTGVSRAQWALFIMATPVYFFAADTFHIRALKELRAMWRPGSPTPILQRFYRFGSMNMLMSLGTSIAYFASITELALASTQRSTVSESSYYFDSVVFLTMFLLIGRFLEAYSKAKTGDTVASLRKLRPDEAILVDITEGRDTKISADLLEIGDHVRVTHGASPPFDGVVVEGISKFDESSLTGESRLVSKEVGDVVYSGTVNKGGPLTIKLSTVSGTSMLDQIIRVVREGQTRRAPIERAADVITGHFVPFVVLVAIVTWVVWLGLGLSGTLPKDYRDAETGGWPLWSLRFAIAVFVIACPCGIGLAAPTALFVGGGLAARHGILVKGGGEAFQEASSLDCIVLDKTGTITHGGDPAVTNHEVLSDDRDGDPLGMAKRLEESSSHPIARAIVSFCSSSTHRDREAINIEEVPGRGIKGTFRSSSADTNQISTIIGNEAFMADHQVSIHPATAEKLNTWKTQGKSVALLAVSRSSKLETESATSWELYAIFAISDPLRPEARYVIQTLRKRGIDVWMLSGDNATTAQAVGAMVGIPSTNIIAGVMPDQKAEKIQYLQKALTKSSSRSFFSRHSKRTQRATVAMVGDGINDSPALAMADVGIAIGSGSDIAISTADFILVSSKLTSLLTLTGLSRTVFRRVWFNFGWALVYNIVAMPIAAGVLYPIRSNGTHVRLDPVWASLAMALSSVSVVCSSLLLRSKVPGVGFRVEKAEKDEEHEDKSTE